MNISRYTLSLFAAIGAALGMAGCAGSSGSNIGVPIIYAGTYSGNYTGSAGDNGAMNIKIDSLGSMTGTISDDKTMLTGNITTGKVDNSGHFNAVVSFTNNTTDTFAGNVSLSQSDHMQGTITETGAESQQVTLDLTRQ